MSFIGTLALLLVITLVVSQLFGRWGIPDVIGQILVGVICGPALLGWFQQTAMIEQFQEIGVIILMFIAGLESDLSLLKKYLKPALAVALGGMILPIVIMGGASYLFGIDPFEAFFIGVIFSATSVSISVAVLREFKKLDSKEGATILGAAVADDIAGVMMLSIMISMMNSRGEHVPNSGHGSLPLWLTLLLQAGFFVVSYFLIRWLAPKLMKISEQMLPVASSSIMAMIVCLGMATAAEAVSLSGAVGSFFAGIAIANTHKKETINRSFVPIGYAMFIPIFFVNVGLSMRLDHFWDSIVLIVVMTCLAIFTKLIGSGAGARMLGFDNNSSYVVGSGMIARGEMALITAQIGYGAHLISKTYYSDIITVIVLATLLAPFVLKHALKKITPAA